DADDACERGDERGGAPADAPRVGLADRRIGRLVALVRHERDAILALRHDDPRPAAAARGRVVVVELLPQMMRVDAHHRVLTGIEVRPAIEHGRRDLVLLRRPALERALDEELEQPRVGLRAAERAACEYLCRFVSDSVLRRVGLWLR